MFGRNIAMAVMGLSLVSTAAFAATNERPRGVNAREHRQVERIRQGVKSDEVTRAELDRLKADEAAVRAEERVYRQSGDGLNKRETRDLEKDLNRTSREIYRARHNGQAPPAPAAQ
jgi:hypothetical protein